jgi:hypothetical protein
VVNEVAFGFSILGVFIICILIALLGAGEDRR